MLDAAGLADDGGSLRAFARGGDHHHQVGAVDLVDQALGAAGQILESFQRRPLRVARGRERRCREEGRPAPLARREMLGHALAGGVEGNDLDVARLRVGRVDAELCFRGRGGACALADHGVAQEPHTDACTASGRTLRWSRAASLNGWSGRRITEAERTRWCAGSTPGGTTSFSASALAARISRWRAMMMPLSVDTRFSLVRSTIGPMLSCSEASCMAKPSTPL